MYGGSRTGTFFLPAPGPRLRPRSGTFFLPLPRLGQRRNPRSQAPATSSWEVPTGGRAILLPTPSPKRCRGPQRCLPTSPGAGSFRPLPFVPPPPAGAGCKRSTFVPRGAQSLPSLPASPPGPWCSSRGCTSPSSPGGEWGSSWGPQAWPGPAGAHPLPNSTGRSERGFLPPGPVQCG